MKKFLTCLILIVMVSMGLFVTACSGDERVYSADISDTDDIILSIFTYDGKGESGYGLMNLGHSFLSFENISGESIIVGDRQVSPGETISLGLWSIKAHFGVWYNMESNYIGSCDKYNGRGSVSIGITADEMEKINEFIHSHDIWTPFHNCSNFAINLWNTVASETETLSTPIIYTPSKLMSQLKLFDSFETNREIITEDRFSYYDGENFHYYQLERTI